jgi:hypothetical protein
MKKKRLFFLGALVCILMIGATAFYWYQKPRTSLNNIKPDYTLTAKELYEAFQQDETKANKQFIEKIIQVTGTVDNVHVTDTTTSLVLSGGDLGGINCSVRKSNLKEQTTPVKGENVKVKGRCIGFLMDVNLIDAVIEK